jgi:hypothetical protein
MTRPNGKETDGAWAYTRNRDLRALLSDRETRHIVIR